VEEGAERHDFCFENPIERPLKESLAAWSCVKARLSKLAFQTPHALFIADFRSVALSIMPAISNRKPYRIGRSRTGLGLFATKPIKKGTEIIEYFGPLLDSRNKKHDAIENKYLFELNGRWTIDGSVRRNTARYINHACRPNAESDVQPRNRQVFIRAIKNIAPGDEINYDYGTDYFKMFLKPIGCKCDACEKKRKLARAEARAVKSKKGAGSKAKAKSSKAKKASNGKAASKTRATTKTKKASKTKSKAATSSRRSKRR
jgi:hypothetical protein